MKSIAYYKRKLEEWTITFRGLSVQQVLTKIINLERRTDERQRETEQEVQLDDQQASEQWNKEQKQELLDKITRLEKENSFYKSEVARLKKLESGKEENTNYEDLLTKDKELEKLTSHLAKVKKKAHHRKHIVIKGLEVEVLELKERLKTEQGHSSDSVLQLQNKLRQKENEWKELLEELAQKEVEIKSLQEKEIVRLESKIRELSERKELNNLEEEILLKFQEVIDSFLTKLDCDFTEEEVENFIRTFDDKTNSLFSVWDENETPNLKPLIKKENTFNFLQKCRGLIYEKKSLKKRLESGDDNITRLEKSLKEFKIQYEETQKLLHISDNERGVLRNQAKEFENRVSGFEDKISELESLLDGKEELFEELEKEKQSLSDQKTKLEEQLKEERKKSSQDNKKIGELEEAISVLNKQIEKNQNSWNRERDALNGQISSLSSQLNNARYEAANKVSGLNSQVYSLQNEMSSLRSKSIDNCAISYVPIYTSLRFKKHFENQIFLGDRAVWHFGDNDFSLGGGNQFFNARIYLEYEVAKVAYKNEWISNRENKSKTLFV